MTDAESLIQSKVVGLDNLADQLFEAMKKLDRQISELCVQRDEVFRHYTQVSAQRYDLLQDLEWVQTE
jgi:hypothetical protein